MEIPSNYDESLSNETLAEGYCKSIKNSKRLLKDGEILFKERRYVGSINYFRLATEEITKAFLIEKAYEFTKNDKEKWKWFWKVYRNHKKKLKLLESSIHNQCFKNTGELNKAIQTLLQTREKSIYVYFNKDNKKFFSPEEIFSRIPTIEDTAKMEFDYTKKLYEMFTVAGDPDIQTELNKIELRQKPN